ncbi:MAG: DUF3488 and transglutaminase-like domain-containing protein [Acidimicrobiales bacterium]|nr:DUF3488 and transglutaminase-like domain-containing protein [Acidimicrobiales bacterium]
MRDHPIRRAAEAALALLTLTAVLGMSRLFAGTEWLGPLGASAVAAHLLALVLRRRGVSLGLSAVAMAVGAALVTTWASYWSTTTLGLPTGTTWTAIEDDLDAAWSLYQDVVAPAPVETGFVVASSLAIWAVAYVADWAAFRLWVPFEATLPAGTLFLFTALLGADRGRGWAVGIYAAALLAFLLLHRLARQDGASHWVAERQRAGRRSLLTAGAALGGLAVVAGTLIGPSLPGADSPGLLDPTDLNDEDEPRVTISPLVDIRSRLVDQSDVEVFQVRATNRSYWRLTSLERFDGRIWSSSGSYGKADGDLPRAVDVDVTTETITQSFSISALAAIWLPAAYEPRGFEGEDVEVRFDEDSATLIVDSSVPSSDGLSYQVTSEVPRLTPDSLTGTDGELPDDIAEGFAALPEGFSTRVQALAQELTAGAGTPYEAARALQDHLRTFTYDLTVQPGHSGDDLERFLFDTRRGYCEQFAGAFAAMARAAGLPSRVAVGFTPGEPDPGEPDPAEPDLYRVRGENAHAWPEVFIASAGWVAFEPTPGRGMPGAEAYTGVPESQADTNDPSTATTRAAVPAPSGEGSEGTVPQRGPENDVDAGGASDPVGGDDGQGRSALDRYVADPARTAFPWVLAVVLLYALGVPAALHLHRRRRRARATTAQQRIALAWRESIEAGALVGFVERASDTYDERASDLVGHLPAAEGSATTLVRALEASDYSAEGAGDSEAEAATTSAAEIGDLAVQQASRGAILRRWFDPRPPLQAWRRERRSAHRHITMVPTGERDVARDLVAAGDRD